MTSWRIGTAGWAIPRQAADEFPGEGSTLERYAARFDAAEINSSFHRSHRAATWERWAASAPPDFSFAVKLPKAITHRQRLVDFTDLLDAFVEEIAPLGERRGPVLVQLPPSLGFDPAVAACFFEAATARLGGSIVCEPRHASWFAPDADALLAQLGIARVAADPARISGAERPGGALSLVYFRLHGSPRPYWSGYDEAALRLWAERAREAGAQSDQVWVIFDNTAGGQAAGDALRFAELIAQ